MNDFMHSNYKNCSVVNDFEINNRIHVTNQYLRTPLIARS